MMPANFSPTFAYGTSLVLASLWREIPEKITITNIERPIANVAKAIAMTETIAAFTKILTKMKTAASTM